MNEQTYDLIYEYKKIRQRQSFLYNEKRKNNDPILEKEYQDNSEILREIGSIKVADIRLYDLIEELSLLSGVPFKDICVEVVTDCIHDGSFSNMESLKNTGRLLEFQIVGDRKGTRPNRPVFLDGRDIPTPPFYFHFFLPLDFDDIQYDGKTLYEHSSLDQWYDIAAKVEQIIVNKHIEDTICHFRICDFQHAEDNLNFYPLNLFQQAIINCTEKEIYSNSADFLKPPQKIRQKKLGMQYFLVNSSF